jgi:small basic protein
MDTKVGKITTFVFSILLAIAVIYADYHGVTWPGLLVFVIAVSVTLFTSATVIISALMRKFRRRP